jgi:hypothetical protein
VFINVKEQENDIIKYSSYKVIKRYEEKTNTSPWGIYFNKSISLIHNNLKIHGIDMELPHCWYRWDDEVVRQNMPHELKWDHEESQYTKVKWVGDAPNLPESEIRKIIDNTVSYVLEKYSNKDALPEFIDLIYENAPFEFQRKYRFVREFFFLTKNESLGVSDPFKEVLLPQISDSLDHFPKDNQFQTIREFIPAFKKFVEYSVNSFRKDYSELEEVSEEFWFWFSYFLRLHKDAHENVNQETILLWREKLSAETEIFYKNFKNHVLSLSKYNKDVRNDELLGQFLKEAESEESEDELIFAEFNETVKDLEAFLNENKFQAKSFS